MTKPMFHRPAPGLVMEPPVTLLFCDVSGNSVHAEISKTGEAVFH
jgi:hypothetical protein